MLRSTFATPKRASICPRCGLERADRQQVRHANLIRRPKRPYTFTQLVTLSDGSTFLHRTTSPIPVYKATKDVRNQPLWNPSSSKFLNIEEDEAGKLAGFRSRFGRGWDTLVEKDERDESSRTGEPGQGGLMDLLDSNQSPAGAEDRSKSGDPESRKSDMEEGKDGKK